MKINERGSVGLTTQKIILAVLLLLLLALVIYGYVSGGFIPLKEKFVGAYDELTLLMASWGDDPDGVEGCRVSSLVNYDSDSEELLRLFEVKDGYGSTFTACQGRICYIDIGGNKFKINKERFYITFNKSYSLSDHFIFNDTPEQLSFYRDLYESSVEFLLTTQGASTERTGVKNTDFSPSSLEIIAGKNMSRFNLMAYKDFKDKESFLASLEWVEGEFEVRDVDDSIIVYRGGDYILALNAFYELVHPNWWFDLQVRSNVGNSQKKLSEIVGGSNDELDSTEELQTLQKFVYDFMNKEVLEAKPSIEDSNKLSTLISGKSIVVDGKTFLLSIEDHAGYPVLKMSSGEEVYGLSFSSNLGIWTFADSNPLALFRYSEGKWVLIEGKPFYKLTNDKFEEVSNFNQVYNFLEKRC